MKRYAIAPMIAPAIGAAQNNHNCSIAHEPWNNATPVERAGFTEVLVTGIEIPKITCYEQVIQIRLFKLN